MAALTLTEDAIGDLAVIAVAGDVDVYTAPELRESLLRMEGRGHSRVLLDLAGCEFLDVTGLGVIVGGLKRARAAGGVLVIAGAPEHVLKIFRTTGLMKVFTMYDSRDQAVAAMVKENPDD